MSRRLAPDEALRQRNPLRLRGYDYAEPGTYFVTAITQGRLCRFGEVIDGIMRLSAIGEIVRDEWHAIPRRRAGVDLDAFVVMPNHLHGIIRILHRDPSTARGEASLAPTTARPGVARDSLGAIIGSFKAGVSRRAAAMRSSPSVRVWQPGYHDHIVRTDGELDRIRAYIAANPANWREDPENPERTAGARQASPPQGQAQGTRP